MMRCDLGYFFFLGGGGGGGDWEYISVIQGRLVMDLWKVYGLWCREYLDSLSWDSLGVDILGWFRYVWHHSTVRFFLGGSWEWG